MTARRRSGTGPILTAFAIWFAHFMLIWAAVEIWPHQWTANVLAWGFTVVALLALGGYQLRLKKQRAQGLISGWSYRFSCGAAAIAVAAVVFSAMPSLFYLP